MDVDQSIVSDNIMLNRTQIPIPVVTSSAERCGPWAYVWLKFAKAHLAVAILNKVLLGALTSRPYARTS